MCERESVCMIVCVCVLGTSSIPGCVFGRLAYLTTFVSAALITTSVCVLHLHGPAGLIWHPNDKGIQINPAGPCSTHTDVIVIVPVCVCVCVCVCVNVCVC